MMHGYNTGNFLMGGGWIWGLFQLALVILIIYVVWQLIQNRRGSSSPDDAKHDALSILDSRFASGEIDEDEYNRKKRAILDR